MTDPLQRTDLNLLVSFRILFEEGCVTRAAERLCISQPAMSKALQRLRLLFDDPLFVRAGRGVTPTPRAQRLYAAVHPVLEQVRNTVLDRPFEPAAAQGQICIIAPDTLATAVMPQLFLTLQREAPRVRLIAESSGDNHLEALRSGKADFSIFLDQDYGEEFQVARLTGCRLVCCMRAGHPLAVESSVSIDQMLGYALISLTLPERRYLPRDHDVAKLHLFLRQYGVNDRASAHVTSLQVAAEILQGSDAVMLGPPLWPGAPGGEGLVSRPCREADGLAAPIALIQHRRTLGSPLHTWIRAQLEQIWADVGQRWLTRDPRAAPRCA